MAHKREISNNSVVKYSVRKTAPVMLRKFWAAGRDTSHSPLIWKPIPLLHIPEFITEPCDKLKNVSRTHSLGWGCSLADGMLTWHAQGFEFSSQHWMKQAWGSMIVTPALKRQR